MSFDGSVLSNFVTDGIGFCVTNVGGCPQDLSDSSRLLPAISKFLTNHFAENSFTLENPMTQVMNDSDEAFNGNNLSIIGFGENVNLKLSIFAVKLVAIVGAILNLFGLRWRGD